MKHLSKGVWLILVFHKAQILILCFSCYAIYTSDATLNFKWNWAFDLWQQLDFAPVVESDLQDNFDWGKKCFFLFDE